LLPAGATVAGWDIFPPTGSARPYRIAQEEDLSLLSDLTENDTGEVSRGSRLLLKPCIHWNIAEYDVTTGSYSASFWSKEFGLNRRADSRITGRAETFPVLAGRNLDGPQESATHQFGATETAGRGDLSDAQLCFLKQMPRTFNSNLLDVLSR
jgi:hypothetical protein